jgi:hypothetical protein
MKVQSYIGVCIGRVYCKIRVAPHFQKERRRRHFNDTSAFLKVNTDMSTPEPTRNSLYIKSRHPTLGDHHRIIPLLNLDLRHYLNTGTNTNTDTNTNTSTTYVYSNSAQSAYAHCVYSR